MLELEAAHLGVEFGPARERHQHQVEFGAGRLVGHQQVSLTRAARATRDRTTFEHRHREPGACGVVGTRGADDAGADDHDVRHRCGLHEPRCRGRGPSARASAARRHRRLRTRAVRAGPCARARSRPDRPATQAAPTRTGGRGRAVRRRGRPNAGCRRVKAAAGGSHGRPRRSRSDLRLPRTSRPAVRHAATRKCPLRTVARRDRPPSGSRVVRGSRSARRDRGRRGR